MNAIRSIQRVVVNIQKKRFWKVGLMTHDLYREDIPVFAEAVQLLPEDMKNERQNRLAQAIHLDSMHRILPKDQWMTAEKDTPYLDPYIEQAQSKIVNELAQKEKILNYRIVPKKMD